jgi:hypothetical protein
MGDPTEAEEALRLLHPPRRRMPHISLPTTPAKAPVNEAASLVTAASLDKILQKAPRRSAPGIDSLRWEALLAVSQRPEGKSALLALVRRIVRAAIPDPVADLLAVSRLVPFAKQSEADILRDRENARKKGAEYLPAVRPIGIGLVIVGVTAGALLHTHEDAIRQALGPHRFGFRVRGGAEIVKHALRITLEASPKMGLYSTDKRNALNSGSREAMYDALVRNPSLHPLMDFRLLQSYQAGQRQGGPTPGTGSAQRAA